MIAWLSDLKTTKNKKTGETRYFIKCCDYWRRVSRLDYESRCDDSDVQCCFSTVINIKNGLIHNFKTVYGEHY